MNPKIGNLIGLKPEHRDPDEEHSLMLILGQEKFWDPTLEANIISFKVLTPNGTIARLELSSFHAYEVVS